MSEIDKLMQHAVRTINEAEGLIRLLAIVDEAQWDASPANRIEREAQVENVSGVVSDPTGSVVSDPARLALRDQVKRSESLLRVALTNVMGVRRGLEIRMHQWELGGGDTPRKTP